MPAKKSALLLFTDKENNGILPRGIKEGFETPFHRVQDIWEDITPLESIADRADRVCYFAEFAACDASAGRDAIAVAWHLGWG